MHYTVLLIHNDVLGFDSMPDDKILVSRPGDLARSWSWSRDLVTKVFVLVSRPGDQGLVHDLEFFSKVLITSLQKPKAVGKCDSRALRRLQC